MLFGIREVPQESTRFTPFELLFGRQPRGLVDMGKEAWEQQPAPDCIVSEHVQDTREQIVRVMPILKEHLVESQCSTRAYSDYMTGPLKPENSSQEIVSWSLYLPLNSRQPGTPCWRRRGQSLIVYASGDGGEKRSSTTLICLKGGRHHKHNCQSSPKKRPLVVVMGDLLSSIQKTDLTTVVSQISEVFREGTGQTNVI
ncbi:hypothetical protein M9458_056460 [Cirrhinus mrigala]|uniref:Uncharacterized protein n=1 Tax=Cirrhinus mrigala TaxID=683832 RepID=A0ABD0MGM6_CIRMR